MTSTVEFEIAFHSPFRVSTGHARSGVDATVSREDPLPNTSVKGVMRATATRLLGDDATIVEEVFGSPRVESPWRWGRVTTPDGSTWHRPQAAARLKIDPCTRTASTDMLAISEQTGAELAGFSVTQRHHLPPEELHRHRLVLAVTGQAIHSLGAETRRGLGWVGITCTNVDLDEQAVTDFLELGAS
ncbi:RAMP superfamily CRISPR-associated protein [Actinopolyspora halophila]|uniref:RAMP superfamily CRISPR-associated protein n=1 Tax=Actinopolyspora halophila TaxID=1850 RepID=UPI00036419EA|nr:RAMP superfamily CRISPR-associated protein [Actinopolyspora halophila]